MGPDLKSCTTAISCCWWMSRSIFAPVAPCPSRKGMPWCPFSINGSMPLNADTCPYTPPGTGIRPIHLSFQPHGGMWPPHCIQDTPGAGFHPDLRLPWVVVVVTKGVRFDQDQNSAFDQTGLGYHFNRKGSNGCGSAVWPWTSACWPRPWTPLLKASRCSSSKTAPGPLPKRAGGRPWKNDRLPVCRSSTNQGIVHRF